MTNSQFSLEKRHLFYDEPKPFNNNQLQIIKLFDGFFLGNHHAGKEHQFLSNNKITLIVNLAAQEVHLVTYKYISILNYELTCCRGTEEKLNLFPILQIIAKVDFCLQNKYEGIVIIAKNIESKLIAFAVLYMMIKYRLTFAQSFAYVQSKHSQTKLTATEQELLQKFGQNLERQKLSQAFQTQCTQSDRALLLNTFKNSQTFNMPNFHGLNFKKNQTISFENQSRSKRVRFAKQIQQQIKPKQLRKQSIRIPSKQSDVGKKITNVQLKLRQFIKQRCNSRQDGDAVSLKHRSQKSEDMILIKSKDILNRNPKKLVASRTEQSPNKGEKKERIQNNFMSFQFSEEDNILKKSDLISMHIPSFDMKTNTLERFRMQTEEEGDSKRDKNYIIHNNKRYRIPKKCYTEEAMISNYTNANNKKYDDDANKKKQVSNYMFKISKSSKNSYKKFKATHLANKNNGKDSEACIKIVDEIQNSPTKQQILALPLSVKQSLRKQKIINLNLNVQIDNINVFHNEEQKPKLLNRIYHPRKISRITLEDPQ